MKDMRLSPGEVEICSWYSLHLGPRFEGAGLRVQFHYNQKPGIHFKVDPAEVSYRGYIEKGLQEGLEARFPDLIKTAAVWVTEIQDDRVNSSAQAFYRVARLVIDQAYSLAQLRDG